MKFNSPGLITSFALAITACGPSSVQTPEPPPVINDTAADTTQETEEAWINPYPSYCFERVGQIGADGNQDEPRRGDVCDAGGGGAGSLERGTGSDPRNTANLHIKAPSLKAIGMKSFTFALNRKSADPKFTTGVHIMDQYDSRALAEASPLNAVLPDRLAHGSDLTGENSMFTHTTPDSARIRAVTGIDFTGYEIASAVLTIDKAVDLPVDDFAAEYARKANMVTGQQYIAGTLTLSLIPLGSTGAQFGPTTFEFAITMDWGYVKD